MNTSASIGETQDSSSAQLRAVHSLPDSLTVQDYLTLLGGQRRFLGKAILIGAAAGLVLAFLLPVRYTAITTILPPSSPSSLASVFAAESGQLGALASLAGNSFGFHSPADVCLAMLRSRTVEDAVIQRFHLMQQYDEKRLSDTRRMLERRTSLKLNLKSGIIALSAQDRDPARAAELANGYVDEFRKFSASMAITEAAQRRQFFERELLASKENLTQAEDALKQTQQSTGMLEPVSESRAMLESAVVLRAQMAAKQVELRSMRTFATEDNPRLIQLKQQIAALQSQLTSLSGSSEDTASDPLLPKGMIPEAGAEFLRRARDVKYNEAVVALLSKQFEVARLDEARQGAAVQVIDTAVTPDRRSSPKRLAILLGSIVFAFCVAFFRVSYAAKNPRTPVNRTAAALLLCALAVSSRSARAQVAYSPSAAQSAACQASAGDTQDLPCIVPGQDPSAQSTPFAQAPDSTGAAGAAIRSGILTGNPRTDQEMLFEREAAAQDDLRQKARRNVPARPPEPHTEFEQMAADSAGQPLLVFGHSLFQQPPETFAPNVNLQVPGDYVLGPGDELRIHVWGQIDADLRVEVDRSGQVYLPHVGEVTVAGVRYSELETFLKQAVGRLYRNFDLSASIGRLHSIQIFVVGQAKAPGVYTISSLSTLVNAVFASGGPSPQGSLRHIQLRRGDRTVDDFDLYDLLVKGDKSHDVSLQPGDVVFIPAAGPQVAISGSVNLPAIYELNDGTALGALIETAGGLSSVADGSSVTVERVAENRARTVLEFPLDAAGRAFALRSGDIVHISSIVPRFDDTVTLRGYVANPGRFPFKPGMHVRDLVPNAEALLPREYWLNRASVTDGRQTEYPVRKQVPDAARVKQMQQLAAAAGVSQTGANQMGAPPAGTPASVPTRPQTIPEYYRDLTRSETVRDPEPDGGPDADRPARGSDKDTLTRDLRRLVPSVNWRYALIQRVNASTLKTQLISFDLGKAIVDGDPASNLALQPGDILTIFSEDDIVDPQQAQTRYVKVEGEVEHPGVYEVGEGETLKDVLDLAGGLTAKAYPYGTRLTRESARIEQQKGLDEMVRTAEAEIRASTVTAVATSSDSGSVAARQNAQQTLLASLRSVQASGRVVLAMRPEAASTTDYPAMALEDGDRIVIPAITNTVTVSGAVYNPASFVYDAKRKVGDYLQLAGKGGLNSNQRRAFVLRADGTVISRQEAGGLFHGGFTQLAMHPGDQIVVPERVDNGVVRALHDWPQILAPLALTALAISAIAP